MTRAAGMNRFFMMAMLAAALAVGVVATAAADTPSKRDVVNTYADIAEAMYADALAAAKPLQQAVDALVDKASAE